MLLALCLSALALAEESPPSAPVEPVAPVEPAAPVEGPEGLLGVTPEQHAAYLEGRRLGVEAARAEGVVGPALLAGAIGFGLSAPAVLLVGPCCGAPIVSLAAFTPGATLGARSTAPPPGMKTGDPSHDLAFSQAYTSALSQRRTTTMLIFGGVGAAAGVGVGMVATKLLLDEWGYTW